MPQLQHRKAITLVELLVAITIVAVVISMSMSVLFSARRLQRKLDDKYSCQRETDLVVREMETTLRLAQCLVSGTCSTVTFLDVQSDTGTYYLNHDSLFRNDTAQTDLIVDSLCFRYFESVRSGDYPDFHMLDKNRDGTLNDDELDSICGINVAIHFKNSEVPDRINASRYFSVFFRNLRRY